MKQTANGNMTVILSSTMVALVCEFVRDSVAIHHEIGVGPRARLETSLSKL